MSRRKANPLANMPAAPRGTSDDVLTLAQERWMHCPLKLCKRNRAHLYEDYPLRDMRTGRVLCSACTLRQGMGYVGLEPENVPDHLKWLRVLWDYAITLACGLLISLMLHTLLFWMGDGMWFVAIIAGIVGGVGVGTLPSRLGGGAANGLIGIAAVGGIVLGTLGSPTLFIWLSEGQWQFAVRLAFNFEVFICTLLMTATAYAVFTRRQMTT